LDWRKDEGKEFHLVEEIQRVDDVGRAEDLIQLLDDSFRTDRLLE